MAKLDYRDILRDELNRRQTRNAAYSLRSFARDLDMSAASISQIFLKKNGLSTKRARDIAARLDLSPQESQLFCDLVASQHDRSVTNRERARTRLNGRREDLMRISLDTFKVIGDWYHFAILETLKTKWARTDLASIPSRLGISLATFHDGLERLARLGLTRRKGVGVVPTHRGIGTEQDIPSRTIRQFHDQILQKASDAMHAQAVEQRDFASAFVAIKAADLPRAKAALREFRQQFYEKFARSSDADAVYCLSMQFFGVDTGPDQKRLEP